MRHRKPALHALTVLGLTIATLSVTLASPSIAAASTGRPAMTAAKAFGPAAVAASPDFTIELTKGATGGASRSISRTAEIIFCYGGMNNPHVSDDKFNVVFGALVWCTSEMTSIDITVEIYYNGYLWGQNTSYSNIAAETSTYTPCLDGSYYGRLKVKLVAPPGYMPRTYTGTFSTPYSFIDCMYDNPE